MFHSTTAAQQLSTAHPKPSPLQPHTQIRHSQSTPTVHHCLHLPFITSGLQALRERFELETAAAEERVAALEQQRLAGEARCSELQEKCYQQQGQLEVLAADCSSPYYPFALCTIALISPLVITGLPPCMVLLCLLLHSTFPAGPWYGNSARHLASKTPYSVW